MFGNSYLGELIYYLQNFIVTDSYSLNTELLCTDTAQSMANKAINLRYEDNHHLKEECQTPCDKGKTIFSLPTEIILRIFSYLDSFCLTNKVKLVCKAWNILASDASLWKSLSFEGKDEMSHVSTVIGKCSQLRQLSIHQGMIDSDLISIAADLPFLNSVSLRFCHILCDPDIFEHFMKSSHRLNSLDLEGCKVSSDVLSKIFYGRNLKYLNLNHCIHLENQHLIQILKSCFELQYLNIDGINFLDEYAIASIFEICSNTLVSLFLDGEGLSDDTFTHLQTCSNLSKFSISFCDNISDITLDRIKKLQNLKYLKLRKGTALSSAGFENLFKYGSIAQLSHLNLSECSLLDDASLISVANCCHELLSLSLNWCWELTDLSLFHVMRKCPKLILLNLTGVVRIQGLFLIHLQQGQLKDLKVIDLQQCGCIEDEQLLKLAELRPSIKIFDFWGDVVIAKPN